MKRKQRVVRFKSDLGINNREMMAWWYCGIYKNPVAGSQPHALVAFREIKSDELSYEFFLRRIPLTALGQVRIGSIWKDRQCQFEIAYENAKFDVIIKNNSWRFVSFYDAWHEDKSSPYPLEIHPLQFKRDKNWMIEFDLQSGGRLLIPCLEFFSRCYGRSAELKRVLATFPWCDPAAPESSKLYAPLDEPEELGQWKVKLRRRMVNSDVVFLAHAKYDSYTKAAAKHIYSQIETEYDPEGRIPVFLKVAPWFQGDMQLKVSGIRFNNGNSFLALQVNGCSSPQGALILRDRDNSSLANKGADFGAPEAWTGVPERQFIKPPDIVNLCSDEDPDHGADIVEIEDDDFVELGEQRLIIDRRREKAGSTAGIKRQEGSSDQYSGGESSGSEKGVGYAAIHAKPVLESQGTLRDVWNAMIYLKNKYPEKIKKVEWFTWECGFCDAPEPMLIGLREFENDKEADTATRKWLYLDPATGALRGILVARLVLQDKWVCILEIQRRSRKKKDQNGEEIPSEESFKGLVCVPSSMEQFEEWLTHTLSAIRYVQGIVKHLEGKHIVNCMSFAHSRSKSEQVAGEAAVLNALEKVNVRL